MRLTGEVTDYEREKRAKKIKAEYNKPGGLLEKVHKKKRGQRSNVCPMCNGSGVVGASSHERRKKTKT